ncbi:MAG: glutaredoxin family protein [Ekhidna sp.]
MKKIIFFIVLIVSLGFKGHQTTTDVAIYGSNSCDHCINLKKALDSAQIEYRFYDIEIDQAKENEMVSLLNKYRRGGHVTFPVAEINGKQLLIGANYKLITEALKKTSNEGH